MKSLIFLAELLYMAFSIYLIVTQYSFTGHIARTAYKIRVIPTSLYPCHTSENCTRYLRCTASGAIKWHYPNSTVITSTHSTTKLIQGNDHHDQYSHTYLQHCQLLMPTYICVCISYCS